MGASIEEIQASSPTTMELKVVYDGAELLQHSLDELCKDNIITGLLVLGVIVFYHPEDQH